MIRNKFANKFTQISNAVLNDKELSLEEKGLFCYLFSKPDCWEFHYNVMRKELSEKSDKTIRKVLNRLVEKGYITKTQVSGENGQFGGIDIEFTDKAFSVTEGKNTDAANLPVCKNVESANLPSNNTNNIHNTDITTNTKKDLLGEEEKEPKRFVKPTIEEIEAFLGYRIISNITGVFSSAFVGLSHKPFFRFFSGFKYALFINDAGININTGPNFHVCHLCLLFLGISIILRSMVSCGPG